jgi:hypothetical protein
MDWKESKEESSVAYRRIALEDRHDTTEHNDNKERVIPVHQKE